MVRIELSILSSTVYFPFVHTLGMEGEDRAE